MCNVNLKLKLTNGSPIYIILINAYVYKKPKSAVTIIIQLYPTVRVKCHYHDKNTVIAW